MTTAIGAYATAAEMKVRANIGTADTADDALIADLCDQVNMFIEGETERIFVPIGGTAGTPTRLYDIDEESSILRVPEGLRTIVTLEIAAYTAAAYETIAEADYFLRPLRPEPGWPYTAVRLSDRPVGRYYRFPEGFETVRITGLFGWTAIPDDITEVALTLAVKLWHRRETGQQDIAGTDEFGRVIIAGSLDPMERQVLRRYKPGRNLA